MLLPFFQELVVFPFLPYLKLTANPPENGWDWKMILSFWGPAYHQGQNVSFRKCMSWIYPPGAPENRLKIGRAPKGNYRIPTIYFPGKTLVSGSTWMSQEVSKRLVSGL